MGFFLPVPGQLSILPGGTRVRIVGVRQHARARRLLWVYQLRTSVRAGRRGIALWPRLRVFRLSLGHAREQRRTGLVPALRSERLVLIRVARAVQAAFTSHRAVAPTRATKLIVAASKNIRSTLMTHPPWEQVI